MNARAWSVYVIFGLFYNAMPANAVEPLSGYHFLAAATQAMQDDEFENPGMPVVDRGRMLFRQEVEPGWSCATCHGEEGEKLDHAKIARFPVYDEQQERPLTLQDQINLCRDSHLEEFPMVYDSSELVALESFVRYTARGEVIDVQTDGPMQPYYEAGRVLYHSRFGQANMSCSLCHDQHQGQHLRGQVLSQGQSNGFPEYRLGSGRVTSLHGRFSECLRSFRAEPYEAGSPEYVNLEIFVNARGNGLRIETPAVRY